LLKVANSGLNGGFAIDFYCLLLPEHHRIWCLGELIASRVVYPGTQLAMKKYYISTCLTTVFERFLGSLTVSLLTGHLFRSSTLRNIPTSTVFDERSMEPALRYVPYTVFLDPL
jgi:hypothetical protein